MAATHEDLEPARRAIREARHVAGRCKRTYWARMDPEPLPHAHTALLVGAAERLADLAARLIAEVERLAKGVDRR
jgi:hypothetical protein